jgi:hypothetical protein
LKSKGLDLKYVVKLRSENEINKIKGLDEDMKERVLQKLEEEGYKSWEFPQPVVRTTASGKIYIHQFTASKTDIKDKIDLSIEGVGDDINSSKIAALQKYLGM